MRYFFRSFLAFCLLLSHFPVQAQVLEDELDQASDPPITEQTEEILSEPLPEEIIESDPVLEEEIIPEEEVIEEELIEEDPFLEDLTPQLFITEVLRGSETSENDHFVELYNPGDVEIELFGWQINGVTSGGDWVDITSGEATAIQPNGYFVISRYTNSSSSVQSLIPGSIKSSLSISEGDIYIELQNPDGVIVDTASIFVDDFLSEEMQEPIYQSYERSSNFEDEEWNLSTFQTHLKEEVEFTFATPAAENSDHQLIGEVTDLIYHLDSYNSEIEGEEFPVTLYDLYLSWIPPEHEWLDSINLYQLDEDFEDKTLLSEFSWEDTFYDPDSMVEFQEYWLYDIDPTIEMVFQVTTIDIFGRESEGEYLWVTPENRVVISEILPDPKTKDTQNEFIELWNLSPFAVDLYGWELDDSNQDNDNSYFFIDEMRDYLLQPGEFIVLDRYETEITLGNEWDEVFLYDADGYEIDYHLYLPDFEGNSWARDPQNPDQWISLNHPTPGAPNIEHNDPPVPEITLQGSSTYMNVNVTGEDSYDPQEDDFTYFWDFGDGTTDDVKNPLQHTYSTEGQKTITLTVTDEYGLSDSATYIFNASEKGISQQTNNTSDSGQSGSQNDSSPDPDIIYPDYEPINEFIPNPEGKDTEGEWIELFNSIDSVMDLSGWYLDDDEGGTSPYQIPDNTLLQPGQYLVFDSPDVDLSLGNSEDTVRLLDPNKNPKQSVPYSGVQESYSYAKASDRSFVWTPLLTPGELNDFSPLPISYSSGSVIFQKVFPNPDGKDEGLEKIVLKNTTGAQIDLTNWMLTDDQSHETLLTSLSISPNSDLILEQDDFVFGLNNSEEILYLYDPAGNLIDQISWSDAPSGQWVFDLDVFVDGISVSVVQVIDGDTLDIQWQDHTFRVRLIGVDTPETVHPFKPVEFYGQKASDYLKNLLTGQTITLTFDENKMDTYGRLLAYVHLDDLFVNASIIQEGYGKAYTRFPFKYLDDFVAYEQAAKEAGVGMWEDSETAILIQEEMEKAIELEKKEEEEMSHESEEESDESIKSGIIFEVESEDADENLENEEKTSEPLRDCIDSQLAIDSFLPNPEKDVTVEWIRIINTGEETACLDGWQLDDTTDGGSKPFTFPNESLEPGEIRTFEKSETGLSLNNSNDSVVLIDPNGDIADQIDYAKTHKNEIFTHDGGDWVSASSQKSSGSSGSKNNNESISSKRFSFGRDSVAYAGELVNTELVGTIENIDAENETLTLITESGEAKILSYKNTGLNFESLFLMINSKEPVRAGIYESGETLQLIDLKPLGATRVQSSHSSSNIAYLVFWILLIVMGIAPVFFMKKKWAFA